MPIYTDLFDVVFDLSPRSRDQLVALRSAEPPRLSRKGKTRRAAFPLISVVLLSAHRVSIGLPGNWIRRRPGG